MEAVIDFLIEYYVWVLVVLVILLITVIGFLADTKKKKKMREKLENENSSINNNINNEYMNYNNMGMNNGFNINPNMDNNMLNSNMNNFNQSMNVMSNLSTDNLNQGMNSMPNSSINNFNQDVNSMPNLSTNNINQGMNIMPNSSINNFNQDVNSMPNLSTDNLNQGMNIMPNSNMDSLNIGINNLNNNISGDSGETKDAFFVPASEQTPRIEPREVVIPKPVETTPIVNNIPNNFGSTPAAVVEPTMVPPVSAAPVEVVNNTEPVIAPQYTPVTEVPLGATNTPINNVVQPVLETPNINVMPQTEPITNSVNPQSSMIMPEQSIMPNPIPSIEPMIGNTVVPNNNVQNILNNQIPNQIMQSATPNVDNSYLAGGTAFVMGNPNNQMSTSDNQMPSGNDNWKL